MEIGLLSCTSKKRSIPSPPAELYMESTFFQKARAFAEKEHDDWYILSAKHHLLQPDGPAIDPYDETLSGARVGRKREWAQTVFEQMKEQGLAAPDNRLIFHAGADYYDELIPLLEGTDCTIEIPTEGLRIGEKLAWYKERL